MTNNYLGFVGWIILLFLNVFAIQAQEHENCEHHTMLQDDGIADKRLGVDPAVLTILIALKLSSQKTLKIYPSHHLTVHLTHQCIYLDVHQQHR